MPPRKSVKKVEIADDSVLDLKSKAKSDSPVSFNISHIKDTQDEFQPKEENTDMVTTDRPISRRKFDPDEMNQRMESFAERLEKAVIKVSPLDGERVEKEKPEPTELIKVKFEKFVQLVATKDFIEVLERNRDEDLVMSSNLLTELASATEEKSERKTPVIFIVGLAIGVIITYLLINN